MARIRVVAGQGNRQFVKVRLRAGETIDMATALWLEGCGSQLLLRPQALPGSDARTLSYDVSGLETMRRVMRTCPPSGEELRTMLDELVRALRTRPQQGGCPLAVLLDAHHVFVTKTNHLKLVCLPLEHVGMATTGTPLELLRFLGQQGVRWADDPRDRVPYERLLAHVREQGDVFSLNRLRAFADALGEEAAPSQTGCDEGSCLVLKREATGGIVALKEGQTYVLGRDEGCDLRFADEPKVSRRHAWVCCEQHAIELADTGSMNGTFVNGKRLAPNQPVHVPYGQRFALSNVLLSIERG